MEKKAAFLHAPRTPLKVDTAPFNQPGPHEILIRNHAVAVNPVDYKQQDTGVQIKSFPCILGMDIAGTVVELLSQQKITDKIAFTDVVVLPLGLTTACWGLFEEGYLEIVAPSASEIPPSENKEKVALVWGGSSSVGASAVQLLAAGGYTVLATASSKNFDFVKSLGATHVFDHTDSSIINQLVEASCGKQVLGAYDAIGADSTARLCVQYLHTLGCGKYMTSLYTTDTGDFPEEVTRVGKSPPPMQGRDGGAPLWNNVWQDFMGSGLRNDKLRTKPDAFVLEGGLERINEAVDLVRKGVSAKKAVV
ncbi:NAD(P)-binding protein [Massarina eburnea CBS 473.64]|uniref:NAD(P)-binding protein n=1 Tax=Massarina eburnea CBS 473.64 TaxID=1395130 RepID=A0A6A6S912_9PLEO|nr:NAD(P)-binding protein [Massarina eburnea CBS 473.64]